jgi:hypothetical protein
MPKQLLVVSFLVALASVGPTVACAAHGTPVSYTVALTADGLPSDPLSSATLDVLVGPTAAPDLATQFWAACPHPQASPCAPANLRGGRIDTTHLATRWPELARELEQRSAGAVSGHTEASPGQLAGSFSLQLDADILDPRTQPAALGKRLIVALSWGEWATAQPWLAASWSSVMRPTMPALPPGYEIASETFATLELTRCPLAAAECETEILFQRGYPNDGEAGFDLPASLLAADGGPATSVRLFLELRVSLLPESAYAR